MLIPATCIHRLESIIEKSIRRLDFVFAARFHCVIIYHHRNSVLIVLLLTKKKEKSYVSWQVLDALTHYQFRDTSTSTAALVKDRPR